jgi:hypothetical protein
MADGSTLISSFLTVSSAITILHEHTRITERTWEEVVNIAIKDNKDCSTKTDKEKDKIEKIFTIPEANGSVAMGRDKYLDSITRLRKQATKYAISLIIIGAILILLSDILLKIPNIFNFNIYHVIAYTYCCIIIIGMALYWRKLNSVVSSAKATINDLIPDKINKAQEKKKGAKKPPKKQNTPY